MSNDQAGCFMVACTKGHLGIDDDFVFAACLGRVQPSSRWRVRGASAGAGAASGDGSALVALEMGVTGERAGAVGIQQYKAQNGVCRKGFVMQLVRWMDRPDFHFENVLFRLV